MLSPPTSPSQRFGAQEKRAWIWSKNLSSTRIPLEGIYLIIPNGELPGSWLEHETFPGGEAVDDMENKGDLDPTTAGKNPSFSEEMVSGMPR